MVRISFAALLVLALSVTAYGQCTDADKKKLEEFDRAWGDAGERGDRAFLTNLYADDFINISVSGTQTKAQTLDNTLKAAEKNKMDPNAPKVTHDFYAISCTQNTATITHRNVITSKAGGKEDVEYSRSIHFLEKRGGKWLVVSSTSHFLGDNAILQYKEQEWNEADLKRDASWFERNYAEDATVISSRTGAITGKKDDIEDLKNRKSTVESAELSGLNVRVDGTVGVVTGMNRVKGKDDKGAAFDRLISFTDTYIKKDGRWLIFATQGTEVKK